jgi:hypothetical protein
LVFSAEADPLVCPEYQNSVGVPGFFFFTKRNIPASSCTG